MLKYIFITQRAPRLVLQCFSYAPAVEHASARQRIQTPFDVVLTYLAKRVGCNIYSFEFLEIFSFRRGQFPLLDRRLVGGHAPRADCVQRLLYRERHQRAVGQGALVFFVSSSNVMLQLLVGRGDFELFERVHHVVVHHHPRYVKRYMFRELGFHSDAFHRVYIRGTGYL